MFDFIMHGQELQAELDIRFTPKKNSADKLGFYYDFLSRLQNGDRYYQSLIDELGISSLSPVNFGNRSQRVFNCGSYLEFKVSPEGHKLHHANFCKDRLCPMCQWRRSMKVFSQVSSCMDWIQDRQSDVCYLFLTLTIKNCIPSDLASSISKLETGFKKLIHDNRRLRKLLLGSFRSLEITYNRLTDTFHPHLHIVLALPSKYFSGSYYISQKEWQSMWSHAAGLDYDPVIDVRVVKNTPRGLSAAVAEVSKYAVKDADYLKFDKLTNTRLVYWLSVSLQGRRLCSFTGLFREARQTLKLDSIEDGDLVVTGSDVLRDDVAYMIVRYTWRNGVYTLCQ